MQEASTKAACRSGKAGQAEYERGLAEYEARKPGAQAQIQQGEEALAASRQQLDEGWAGYQQMADGLAGYDAGIAQLEENIQNIKDLLAVMGENPGGEAGGETGENPSGEGQVTPPSKEELEQQLAVLEETLTQTQTKRAELQATADTAKTQLEEGEAGYQGGTSGDRGRQRSSFLTAQRSCLRQKPPWMLRKRSWTARLVRSSPASKQIDDGWAEIRTQEQTLKDGEAKIAESEQELADAKKEYEEGKAEAEAEFADAEQEIADAQEEIDKIEDPDWYLYDRGNLPEYDGYGENADRMRALGRVFPVLFFLVAALISLTSMTRMVEEQRIEIGTMKALGYDKSAIAAKYLGYAFVATLGGSILGVLFGEKVLPYIIIYAYGIMYQHFRRSWCPTTGGMRLWPLWQLWPAPCLPPGTPATKNWAISLPR